MSSNYLSFISYFELCVFSQLDFVITEKQFSPIIGLNGIIANLNTNVLDLKKQIIEKLIL